VGRARKVQIVVKGGIDLFHKGEAWSTERRPRVIARPEQTPWPAPAVPRTGPRLFIDHPHFSIFPGEGVEVVEIMPVPTR